MCITFDSFISSNTLLRKTVFFGILLDFVALGFNISFCPFFSARLVLVILAFVLTCLLILCNVSGIAYSYGEWKRCLVSKVYLR